ncbi:MAG: glycosyltransferase family 2 protein [Candidatus Omnitrophica bacterium]|nr:glycosyltransferase family 2 protein [Candidatus Omnitrophota bacterium]
MPEHKISILIPCYNEEPVIRETYVRVKGVLDANGYNSREIIFIDDGSKDGTPGILEQIAAQDKGVKVISFSRNFGHQAAVSSGIKNCSGDIAVIIDADLQDPPELIPEMIKKHDEEKCNVVYGVRTSRKGEGFFKKFTAKFFYRILNSLSEVRLPLDTGDFRLIDRKVIEEFKNLREKNKYIRGLISWVGFKQAPIYYQRDLRAAGRTKYPFRRMVKFAGTGIFYFTKKPLQLAMGMGFASIILSFCLVAYVFLSDFRRTSGWASTLVIIIFFGGIQLLTVGILGSYIGSIFDEVKGRPEYIIEKKVNF